MAKEIAVAAMLAGLVAAPALAQDEWQSEVAIYGWFTGLTGEVDTPLGSVAFEQSFSDILDQLDMAFMGAVQVRRGRWSLIGDLVYTDLSQDFRLPPGVPILQPYGQVDTSVRLTTFSGYALYDAVSRPDLRLGLGLGLRAVSMEAGIDLTVGAPSIGFSGEDDWIDPVVAGRLVWTIDPRWFSTLLVDYGGGDGDTTWQVLGTVGYRLNDRWSVQGGYRHMTIEHDLGGQLPISLELGGPIAGFVYRF
jgi:hypothetical protein